MRTHSTHVKKLRNPTFVQCAVNVSMYHIAGLFCGEHIFADLLLCAKILFLTTVVAYKVWLIRKCILQNFCSRNTLMPGSREKFTCTICIYSYFR